MHNEEKIIRKERLIELAWLFLKLGLIGFGGPAVHIALMEKEVVGKRNWISEQHFLDLVGATNLIPGPNSTEMTMHIGLERAGWRGLVVAGCCFIVPAVLITSAFAWAYEVWGRLPQVKPFIYGIKPAIIALLLGTMIGLARKAVKSVTLALIGTLCMVAVLLGANEILVFFSAGLVGVLLHLARRREALLGLAPFSLLQVSPAAGGLTNGGLFWIFLKVGSILYGSGYVLFAFLDAELVAKGMLSKQALTDAIAVGQFTPGPVFSAATFIGWQIGGGWGAVAATIGIFLPSFIFVGLLNPLIPALRRSPLMSAFLDTVNVAAVALIVAVVAEMGLVSLAGWRSVVILVVGFGATFFFKRLNSAFIVLGGALLGYLLWLIPW
jgi:chromate transporter